jgi:hypothetical protein
MRFATHRNVIVIRSMMPRERESSAASRAITALAIRLATRLDQSDKPDACTLELMFVLPDADEGPVFEGMRLSAYAEGEGILVVEAAVPLRMLDSEHVARYVAAVAADAVDAASEFFGEQQVTFDADRRHEVLRAISVSDLQGPLKSRHLPESAWVDATSESS